MSHPLDRPVWCALAGDQSHLAIGDTRARRFDPAYGPFAAAADASDRSIAALAALVPPGGEVWTAEREDMAVPPSLAVVRSASCVQMVMTTLRREATVAFVPLGDDDAPEMRALAALTEPGPFAARTHRLGRFVGIKVRGRLVAMAGERMRLAGFTEVSGVCTHPDHRGRGHAGALMAEVARAILANGDTPFLHAYASNTGAIALYEALGFAHRCTVVATVLGRAEAH